MARRRRPLPVVQRLADGFAVNLEPEERDLLLRLLDELRDLLLGSGDEAIVKRLFPPAYHLADDAEADAEYQRLMREELVASRLSAIGAVGTLLDESPPLAEHDIVAFMQALNALRLVLGTLLDVGEDTELDDVDDDHPLAAEHHLYGYLSHLLDASVRALTGWEP